MRVQTTPKSEEMRDRIQLSFLHPIPLHVLRWTDLKIRAAYRQTSAEEDMVGDGRRIRAKRSWHDAAR